MSQYFTNEKLDEIERQFKTIPVDGDGHAQPVEYTEHFVRGTVLKLIADLRSSQEEAAKQKFRFEYTENLVRLAHADRDEWRKVSDGYREEMGSFAAELTKEREANKRKDELLQGFLWWEEMHPSIKHYNKSQPFMVNDDYETYRKIVEESKAILEGNEPNG